MRAVMYIVINKDLNMSPGKIGAHTAHAVFDYIHKMMPDVDEPNKPMAYILCDETLERFKRAGDTIIILKASEKQMLKFEEEGYTTVRDMGRTEVEPNSITAVNLGIYDKDEGIPKFIQKLRLL